MPTIKEKRGEIRNTLQGIEITIRKVKNFDDFLRLSFISIVFAIPVFILFSLSNAVAGNIFSEKLYSLAFSFLFLSNLFLLVYLFEYHLFDLISTEHVIITPSDFTLIRKLFWLEKKETYLNKNIRNFGIPVFKSPGPLKEGEIPRKMNRLEFLYDGKKVSFGNILEIKELEMIVEEIRKNNFLAGENFSETTLIDLNMENKSQKRSGISIPIPTDTSRALKELQITGISKGIEFIEPGKFSRLYIAASFAFSIFVIIISMWFSYYLITTDFRELNKVRFFLVVPAFVMLILLSYYIANLKAFFLKRNFKITEESMSVSEKLLNREHGKVYYMRNIKEVRVKYYKSPWNPEPSRYSRNPGMYVKYFNEDTHKEEEHLIIKLTPERMGALVLQTEQNQILKNTPFGKIERVLEYAAERNYYNRLNYRDHEQ